jgi:hypothetical protein
MREDIHHEFETSRVVAVNKQAGLRPSFGKNWSCAAIPLF